jgi:hypothetical protein
MQPDPSPRPSDLTPVPCDVRVLWAPKDGDSDDEYEDATAADEAGLAALADGATQGIFCRAWAGALVERYRCSAPDLGDPDAVAAWLDDCRAAWRSGIRYGELHGLAQDKVDRTGAAAAFVGLRLSRVCHRLRWRAGAVGDSCLFRLRRGRLRASFPLTHSSQFGVAPDLISSHGRRGAPAPFVTAAGAVREGDCFALASDAVAQFLLRRCEEGHPPDWLLYWEMSLQQWRDELERLRQQGELVNDDSTLLLLRPRG